MPHGYWDESSFRSNWPHTETYRAVAEADLTPYRQPSTVVDPLLIELWKADGWSCYADGLLWTSPPEFLSGIVRSWLPADRHSTVLARSAWGQFFTWDGREVVMRDVLANTSIPCGSDPLLFYDVILSRHKPISDAMLPALFKSVRKGLPRPSSIECYGFAPLLSLGGSKKAASVQIFDMRMHLDLLRQVG